MLSLLPVLAENLCSMNVWGLTSLHDLWLLAADDWRLLWLVCITAIPSEGYRIQYRRVDADSPWPKNDARRPIATVEGIASDETTACRLVLSAMSHSGGWSEAFSDSRDSR